jgi:hypothetical protein
MRMICLRAFPFLLFGFGVDISCPDGDGDVGLSSKRRVGPREGHRCYARALPVRKVCCEHMLWARGSGNGTGNGNGCICPCGGMARPGFRSAGGRWFRETIILMCVLSPHVRVCATTAKA